MRKELEEIQKIDQFLNGELSEEDAIEFQKEMDFNPSLKIEVEKQKLLQEGIQSMHLRASANVAFQKYKTLKLIKLIGLSVAIAATLLTTAYFLLVEPEAPVTEPDEPAISQPQIDTAINHIEPIVPTKEVDTTNVVMPEFTGTIEDIVIEAEDYTAFYDLSPENVGNHFERDDAVDIYLFGNDVIVGHTFPEEWLEYTFDIPQTGNYDILFSVASAQDSVERMIDVSVNNDFLSTMDVPNTGSWIEFENVKVGTYKFRKGKKQKMKLDFKTGWINIDKIIIRHSKK